MEVARRRRRPTSFGEIRSIDNRQSVPPTYTAVIPICMDWSGAAAPSFRRMEMPTNRKELLARTRRKAFGSIGRLGLTVETIIRRGNKKKRGKKKVWGTRKGTIGRKHWKHYYTRTPGSLNLYVRIVCLCRRRRRRRRYINISRRRKPHGPNFRQVPCCVVDEGGRLWGCMRLISVRSFSVQQQALSVVMSSRLQQSALIYRICGGDRRTGGRTSRLR